MTRLRICTPQSISAKTGLVTSLYLVSSRGLFASERPYRTLIRLWGRYLFSDRVESRLLPALPGDRRGVRGAAWLLRGGLAPVRRWQRDRIFPPWVGP